MTRMTILEAAEHFGISKEAIHNRVRRGSLEVILVDGVKMVDIDASVKANPAPKTSRVRKAPAKQVDERYYKLLEDQNSQLHVKVEKLEGETRTLRDQKEEMLIQERIKIEQIYKDKDEQLKNFLTTLSAQFMLNAPSQVKEEEHVEVEIEEIEEAIEKDVEKKGELISLKKYLKKNNYSPKKQEKIKMKFVKKAKIDERIIVIGSKYYMDTFKYDYSDLLK
ncbi:MAG: DNA-binding protein [Sulfurimonas sp.]|nr:DNA-binding protein [Sulfurimonas sp.]MDQ7060625.1 DNA-binding protein [Sulfurimonas sp.]